MCEAPCPEHGVCDFCVRFWSFVPGHVELYSCFLFSQLLSNSTFADSFCHKVCVDWFKCTALFWLARAGCVFLPINLSRPCVWGCRHSTGLGLILTHPSPSQCLTSGSASCTATSALRFTTFLFSSFCAFSCLSCLHLNWWELCPSFSHFFLFPLILNWELCIFWCLFKGYPRHFNVGPMATLP